jgi:hypothetical protein
LAMAGKSKPGKIHLRIVEVMKRFPNGISGGPLRHELEKEGLEPGEQTHLDRRKRDLKKWFVIKKEVATTVVDGKNRKVTLYNYAGVRGNVVDEGQVSLKERAEVIHSAHGRCQMCGKSVEKRGITFRLEWLTPETPNWRSYGLLDLWPTAIRSVLPFKLSQKCLDLGFCENLAIGIESCQEIRQRLQEVGKDAFEFWKRAAKGTYPCQVFS